MVFECGSELGDDIVYGSLVLLKFRLMCDI